TIWPTRDGWWCLLVVIGLGVAAINTGNNLLYLLVSLLLSLIVVSGVLSEQSMRGVHREAEIPEEIYAGAPALFGALVQNGKRWLTSYSVTLELLARGGPARFIYVPRLEAGAERFVTWEVTLPARGRHRLAGLRLTTRFPFGLFVKASRVMLEAALSEAASATVHLIRAGSGVELVGRGIVVPLGRGPGQSRRILTALALYHPGAFRAAPDTHARGWRSLRELHIELGRCARSWPSGSSPIFSCARAWGPSPWPGSSRPWAPPSWPSPCSA